MTSSCMAVSEDEKVRYSTLIAIEQLQSRIGRREIVSGFGCLVIAEAIPSIPVVLKTSHGPPPDKLPTNPLLDAISFFLC